MTWRPNVRVRIGGVDVSADTIDRVAVRRGRDDPFQQPRAGYARLSLLDPSTLPRVLTPVSIAVEIDGQFVTLWHGEVSDAEVEVVEYGTLGQVAVATITAVGPLARVHRGQVGVEGYGQALDGDRIAEVLADSMATLWLNTRDDVAWSTVAEDRRWRDWTAADRELIDTGVYEVQANYAGTDPWRIVQQAALDGGGALYETRDGRIGYADSTRRFAAVQADGYLTPPDAAVLPLTLRSSVAFGDLANVVELTYANGTVTARDDDAVRRYGATLADRVSTELLYADDAQDRADLLVAFRSRDTRLLDTVTLDVGAPGIDDAMRADLLTIDPNQPIRLRNVPDVIVPGTWTGFVEAVAVEIDRYAARMSLTVSPYEWSTFGGRWLALDDTIRWRDTDPTLTWPNAQELVP